MNDETARLANEREDADFPDTGETITVEGPKSPRAPVLLALLALIVSVTSLLIAGWLVLTREPVREALQSGSSEIEALSATVSAAEQSVTQMGRRLEALADRDVVSNRQLDDFRQQFEERLDLYGSLPDRMHNLENTMSSVQGIATGVRDKWLLAEAEYYMQIANAQLQLAGNPDLAKLALLQADERIQQLANPALTGVRRALASELQALDLVSRPDIEGVALTLSSLGAAVDLLPLRADITRPGTDDEKPADDLTGFDRAVESLKSTMSGVVSVRRTDETVRPLIAPESAYFLRANLSLQLQAARLAMLREENSIFQQSLDDAASWLTEYYDTGSAKVQSALKNIADIRDRLHEIKKPDISGSLRLLRQHNTLSASPKPAPPAGQGEPSAQAAPDDDGTEEL